MVEAVESVLAQSLGEWRLLVHEDGAGDPAVAAALAPYLEDGRVSHAASGQRIGAARSMSRLVAAGDAPYVAILHDDDRWHPGFLERRVRFLDAHPECGMAFSEHLDIDRDGSPTGRSVPKLDEGLQPHEEFARRMLAENLVATPTVVVRRSAYEAVGPAFDEGFPTLYDWEMMLRLAQGFPAGYLRVWDAEYRTHGVQTSAAGDRGREFLRLYEHAESMARRAGPALLPPEEERRRLRAGYLLSAALDDVGDGRRREAARRVRAALRAYPRSALTRRFAAAALGVVLPAAGRRAIASLRATLYQRRGRPASPLP